MSVKSFSVEFAHLKNVIISPANNISNVIASLQEKNPATYEVNLVTNWTCALLTWLPHQPTYFIVLQVLFIGVIASQNKFVLLHSHGGKGTRESKLPPPILCVAGFCPFLLGFFPLGLLWLQNIEHCWIISPYFSCFPFLRTPTSHLFLSSLPYLSYPWAWILLDIIP